MLETETTDLAADGLLLLAAFESLGPLYVARPDGTLVHASREYRQMVGGGRAGLAPQHLSAVAGVVAPGEPLLRSERHAGPTGTRDVRVWHRPVRNGNGQLIAVAGSFQDDTAGARLERELRHERTRFHDLTRAQSDWVWETDGGGRIMFLSEQAATVLGMPAQLARGRPLVDLLREETPARRIGLAMGERVPSRELRADVAPSDGTERIYKASGVPHFDEQGRFGGYRGTATDVTDRLATEAALARTNADLERSVAELNDVNAALRHALAAANSATKAKDAFLASMSHELRTPLNAILGMAQVMEMGMFGELHGRYAHYPADMLRAGRHLQNLVDDILDTARIEAGSMLLSPEPVALSELIDDARKLVEQRAADKRIDLTAAALRNGEVVVQVDRTRGLQIFANLLVNAVKFTPEGGRVGIDCTPAGDDTRACEVVIWDSGPGVPPEQRDHIFEPFNRGGRDVLSEPAEGVGLGLPLARNLARLMGGDLRLSPEPGRGGRFVVMLPLAGAARLARTG